MFEKLQMVTQTVALQALSQSNVLLLPKACFPPSLSAIAAPTFLQLQPSSFSFLAIWYHSSSAPSSAAHWTLSGPHLTHWYRRNLSSQVWGFFLPFYSIKLAHGRRATVEPEQRWRESCWEGDRKREGHGNNLFHLWWAWQVSSHLWGHNMLSGMGE